jgi:hypothetical protein
LSKQPAHQFTPAHLVLGFAATVLVVLVSWAAVRAGGPVGPDAAPVMVQPPGLSPAAVVSATPSFSVAASPSPTASFVEPAYPEVTVTVAGTSSPSVAASSSPSRKPRKSKSPKPSVSASPSPARTSPSPSPAPANDLDATYTTSSSWRDGFIGNVQVVNKGSVARDFTVTISYSSGTSLSIRGAWNGAASAAGSTVTLRGGQLAPGASITAGFQAAKGPWDSSRATGCTVGGGGCRVS